MSQPLSELKPSTIRFLAFEGGGAMGVSYLGPLVALEQMKVTPSSGSHQIEGVAGTSIGAVVAMCVGMGYSAKDIDAKLVKDRAYRALHAETMRRGVSRKFDYDGKGGNSKTARIVTEGSLGATPGKDEKLWPALDELLSGNLKKYSKTMEKRLMAFLGDWLTGTITAMLSDDRLLTEFIYEGALGALRDNRALLAEPLLAIDGVRSIFNDSLGDNQFFVTQFNAWLDGEPFDEGVFESEADRRRYVFQTLGGAVLGVVIYLWLILQFAGEKKGGLRNKFLLLKVIAQNYAFNASQPWLYRGWTNILTDLKRVGRDAGVGVTSTNLNAAFENLEAGIGRYLRSLIESRHFRALTDQIFQDGALFSGLTVRAILAELIYARVEVDKDNNFTKREPPIQWGDKKSRDEHPALSRKGEAQIRSEYYKLGQYLGDPPQDLDAKKYKKHYDRLQQLGESVDAFEKLDEERERQVKAIMSHFTLEDYAQVFSVELCTTGTNITTGRSCFFNRYITPAMPVVEAVGISSSFPFLFKPIRLTYTGSKSAHDCYHPKHIEANYIKGGKQLYPPTKREDWYRANYHGWFIDGGLLTNIPIQAFNGHLGLDDSDKALDPINMKHEPLNPHVLALVLDKMDHEEDKKTKKTSSKVNWIGKVDDFRENKHPDDLLTQFMAVLYETPGVHATFSTLPTKAFRRKQVVMVDTPGVTLFDLVPLESSLRESDWSGYQRMAAHFPEIDQGEIEFKDQKSFESHFNRDNRASRSWRSRAANAAQRRLSNRIARRAARAR